MRISDWSSDVCSSDLIEGSPLAAGLVAFGAGMVISALIPASEKEAQLASRAVATAKEQAQPLVEEAKSVGQDIGANQIGRASGRERVCKYGSISVADA